MGLSHLAQNKSHDKNLGLKIAFLKLFNSNEKKSADSADFFVLCDFLVALGFGDKPITPSVSK